MVCWNKGALRRNCRQKIGETSFSPSRVFLFSRIPGVGFGVFSGIFGLLEPETLGRRPFLSRLVLRFSMLGEWLTHGDLWVGRAGHPGPTPFLQRVGVEVFSVGGWLTHGDLALEVGVDFLAVVEHHLIPARVRSEWTRLKGKGLASVWAPGFQDSSRVGNAGVGVIIMRGAPVALPSFATAV